MRLSVPPVGPRFRQRRVGGMQVAAQFNRTARPIGQDRERRPLPAGETVADRGLMLEDGSTGYGDLRFDGHLLPERSERTTLKLHRETDPVGVMRLRTSDPRGREAAGSAARAFTVQR